MPVGRVFESPTLKTAPPETIRKGSKIHVSGIELGKGTLRCAPLKASTLLFGGVHIKRR